MFSKTFLLFLVSAHAASAAIYNGTSIVRTFAVIDKAVTDEPLDLEELLLDDDVTIMDGSRSGLRVRFVNGTAKVRTNSSKQLISDEAQLFLTGPMSTIFIPSFYTLVCLISVPLNAIALVTFTRQIRPMKPAVIYMLNLAWADLLFALLLPFKISYHFSGNNWTFGPVMCRVVTAAFYCNMYCSVLLITCISVDRLLAVVYPIDSLAWRRPRTAVIACLAMWILALAGSVPLVVSEQTVHLKEMGITTCHDVQDLAVLQWYYKIYFSTICCTLFFLPLLITMVCYSRVIWTLTRVPHGVAGRSRRKARAVVMALTVLVLFVVCFTPTNCVLLAHYLQFSHGAGEVPDGTYAAYLVFMCLGSLSCCLDPLVYYFGSSQCQRQLSSVLGCRKGMEGGKRIHSSSGSSRSSTRTSLKSSLKKSKTNTPITKMDSFQANLDSQYKKLLV
uniref:proteinase-activated receptor 1-like n=1 Tax=Centroberyx gerrardi TaxID=166262 RepID=UPI003AAC34E9